MALNFKREIGDTLDNAIARVTRALADEGFGILTRIDLHLKVDWRDGPAGRLQAKTAKVEQLLGRKLRT